MALFARILGTEEPRIPVHTLSAVLQEFGLGRMTGPQAQAALGQLDAGEVAEAQALLAAVQDGNAAIEVTGTTNSARVSRSLLVHHVLLLVEAVADPYTTEAAIKTRLGI